MNKTTKQKIIQISEEMIRRIERNEKVLIDLLLDYESFVTAEDEIFRSKDSLENIEKEIHYLTNSRVNTMCTFFPVNLPLYSLVIFSIIPSLMSGKVFIRPPHLIASLIKEIINILDVKSLFPNVEIVEMERGLFRDAYASVADVVLFTGKYENAIELQSMCPDALFIYNGAGINPVVVTESADINLATKKVIEMRTFNSGQDCAGSDAILVHKSVAKKFINLLKSATKEINVGDYHNRSNTVGRITKQDRLPELRNFFEIQKKYLIYGGEINLEKGIVFPTIFVEEMKEVSSIHFTEFFAPVFYVLVYEGNNDLKKYFLNQHYQDHAMYISLFGESSFINSISSSVILKNKIINDTEQGNDPYGGYGSKANFVIYRGKKMIRPILISREIARIRPFVNATS